MLSLSCCLPGFSSISASRVCKQVVWIQPGTGVTNPRNYGPRNLRNPRNLTKITYFDRNIYFERIFNNDVSKQLSLVINL